MTLRTAAAVKAQLERLGVSVTSWAKANKLRPSTVHQLLAGNVKGTRGEAHRAAVLLGMKDGQILAERSVKDALAPTRRIERTRGAAR